MVSDIDKELKEEEKEVKHERVEMQMEAPKSENPHLQARPHLIFWAVVVVLFTAVLFFMIGYNYGQDNVSTSTAEVTESDSVDAPPVPEMPSATAATDDTTVSAEATLSTVAE